ncbi:MAG: HEAT repeat domain-containing protein, partial [Anaerolineales bacterium]|nr:HEAT repeat domain-containing protein [Anaerolineales bacterium]
MLSLKRLCYTQKVPEYFVDPGKINGNVSLNNVHIGLKKLIRKENLMNQKILNEDALPHDGDVKSLIADLKSPEKDIRKSAVVALGEIGDESVIQPLIAVLNDEDFLTKWAAEKAIKSFGALAYEPLITAFTGSDEELRSGAAGALGNLGDVRAVAPLIAALKTEGKEVRFRIIGALGRLGDRKAVEPLLEALDDEEVRGAAASSLGMMGDSRAVQPLIAILGDGH